MTRPLTESQSNPCRSRQTTATAGLVSGLFFAKTKLPLRGGEEVLGEPPEGSHVPDQHPLGPRMEKEDSTAWHTPGIGGSSAVGWGHKTERREEGSYSS